MSPFRTESSLQDVGTPSPIHTLDDALTPVAVPDGHRMRQHWWSRPRLVVMSDSARRPDAEVRHAD